MSSTVLVLSFWSGVVLTFRLIDTPAAGNVSASDVDVDNMSGMVATPVLDSAGGLIMIGL